MHNEDVWKNKVRLMVGLTANHACQDLKSELIDITYVFGFYCSHANSLFPYAASAFLSCSISCCCCSMIRSLLLSSPFSFSI